MRLTEDQTRHIVQATRNIAGPGATARLFGSRLDDNQRGGDIDLLVQCETLPAKPVLLAAQLIARLQRVLGSDWWHEPVTPRTALWWVTRGVLLGQLMFPKFAKPPAPFALS